MTLREGRNAENAEQAKAHDPRAVLATCVAAAVRASDVIRRAATDLVSVAWESKGPADFVSTVDRGAEEALGAVIRERHPGLSIPSPRYENFRVGDVRHSEADIGKAARLLGYRPEWKARNGLAHALPWYENHPTIRRSSIGLSHERRAV